MVRSANGRPRPFSLRDPWPLQPLPPSGGGGDEGLSAHPDDPRRLAFAAAPAAISTPILEPHDIAIDEVIPEAIGLAPSHARSPRPLSLSDPWPLGLQAATDSGDDRGVSLLPCGCAACQRGGRGAFPGGRSDSTLGSVTLAAAQPAASLQTLADYLRVGFWQERGTVPRRYNLGDSTNGPNPNNGELRYNISGWNFDTNGDGTLDGDSNGLSTARRELVREVFKLYQATLGIRFVETTATDTSVDLFFTDNYSGAYAYAAGASYDTGVDYSVINVASSWYSGISSFDSYTVQTFFHEIGHALGLGHQGLYNGTGAYSTDAKFANDSWQESMMSYFSQTDNPTTGASFAFLQSPMSVDWLALDDIYRPAGYGVANAFRGDTIYGVGTTISAATSRIWNEFSTYAGRTAYTIVDGDGNDTLDVSNFTANQLINLAPSQPLSTTPSLSNIGGKIGNLSIAAGTVIESAIGGSGNDTFYGNDAANTFRGGAGNDTFFDSLGSDIYYGDADLDALVFTESIDLFRYELSGDSLLFSRTAGSVDVDRVWNGLENLSFAGVTYTYSQLLQTISAPLADVTITAVNGLPSGSSTNSTALSFSGSLSLGLATNQTIAFFRDGTQLGNATLSAPGATSWTFSLQENAGTNLFAYTARVVDSATGRLGALSSPFTLTVDTVAPLVTVNSLQSASTTPLLSGTVSEAAAQVSVRIGSLTRTAVNNGNGTWSLQWNDPLAAGASYDVAATATDAAGNVGSDTSTSELTILAPPPAPSPILYLSLASAITTASPTVLGGLTARTNDIIAFDGTGFSIWLNGNASGLSGAVLRDFHIVSANEVVVAFQSPVTLSGIAFDDSDLARLSRTATGGFTLSMLFDGSDVGLTTNAEAIDAVTGLSDGSWLISTRGSGSVPVGSTSLAFAAEDILRFTPTSLGTTTSGGWSLHADMSDVAITGTGENVTALATAADGRQFLATSGNAAATGLSAANEDVFVFRPTSLGATTAGSFDPLLAFDGSLYGLGANALTGIALPV